MKLETLFTLALAMTISGALPGAALAARTGEVKADPGAMEGKHFDPKGKMPSQPTIALQTALRAKLTFEDERDFEEAKKGFIAAPPYK